MRSATNIGAPKGVARGLLRIGRPMAHSLHVCGKRERLPSSSVLVARHRRLCQHHPSTGEHQSPHKSQNSDCSLHSVAGPIVSPPSLKEMLVSTASTHLTRYRCKVNNKTKIKQRKIWPVGLMGRLRRRHDTGFRGTSSIILSMGEAVLMDRQILRAKLYVPRYRANAVPRSRLHERLDEGARRDLTVVSAPAGFGKTTLLADWSQRSEP